MERGSFRQVQKLFLLGAVAAVAAVLVSPVLRADVKLPAVIGDNMVLQRAINVPIWGWADPGEKVTVTLGKQAKSATAGTDGKWLVRLDSMEEGGPATMIVSGKNKIEVQNILIGEVWVCSGQSNMGFTVRSANDAEKEIASADYPQIRLFSVPLVGTQEPQYDCKGKWVVCSPETVGSFSAVGYFFGREIYRELKIPVGLVDTSWWFILRGLGAASPSWRRIHATQRCLPNGTRGAPSTTRRRRRLPSKRIVRGGRWLPRRPRPRAGRPCRARERPSDPRAGPAPPGESI